MRFRFTILFSLLIVLLGATAVVSAQSSDLITWTNTAVNIRSGPGTEWRILGTANAGTTVRLDGMAFEGTWVRGITSTGIIGWIYATGVSASPDQTRGLRSIWVEEPFTLSAPAQQGGDPNAASQTFTVTISVNLRSGPGTEWRILGQVNPGELLNMDGRSY